MTEIIVDALRSSILISGLVVVMMMLIETINIGSHGGVFRSLKDNRPVQVVVSALLGAIPGCMGGFASVSLYTHGIISFGALVAMMIASSGDEAFVMLALMPGQAWWIMLILLAIAVLAGLLTDLVYHPSGLRTRCEENFSIHREDIEEAGVHGDGLGKGGRQRHFGWKRVAMFVGVAAFIAALLSGLLEHEDQIEVSGTAVINLLSEEWMYWMFGAFSMLVLGVLIRGGDHFVEEHLWKHIVCRHLPAVFGWTFGVLLLLGAGRQYFDISSWISSNTALMIVLAALVGIIPESGPHLVFVTLYASGVVPLPVLLSSCISQDGHASLPLLAESKKSFALAKAVNFVLALVVGFMAVWLA